MKIAAEDSNATIQRLSANEGFRALACGIIGSCAENVDEQDVVAGGKRIPSATVLWTAGLAASPLPKMLGTKTDCAGRALVDPFLRVEVATGVFVVGDAVSVTQN